MGTGSLEEIQVSTKALEEFFQFLQCQLRMEALQCFQQELELEDPCAASMWPHFQAWVKPNLGRKEKWMPFHTVLGVHELFMVQNIHHGPVASWDSKRKFFAMFVFRAHCKGDFFREAQLPHLLLESFWKNPLSQFSENGQVTKSMLEYRRRTKQPLQTMAFRCIPARLCEDDDENLVRNIALRTRTLLEVAGQVWPIVCDSAKSPEAKFDQISREIQRGHGLGDTWAKMLMASIDIAYPDLGLLSKNCDVGVGAVGGLRRLMPNSGLDAEASSSRLAALKLVTKAANRCKRPSVASFWQLLSKVERVAHQRYKKMPLIMKQVATVAGALSAVTVQVQLCEWRQLLEFLEKNNINNNSSSNNNSNNNTNSNRVSGKRLAPLSTSASNNNTNNNPSVAAASEDEDDLPLKGLAQASAKLRKISSDAALGGDAADVAASSSAGDAVECVKVAAGSPEARYVEVLQRWSPAFGRRLLELTRKSAAAAAEMRRHQEAVAAAEAKLGEAAAILQPLEKALKEAEHQVCAASRRIAPADRQLKRCSQLVDSLDAVVERSQGNVDDAEPPVVGSSIQEDAEALHREVLQHVGEEEAVSSSLSGSLGGSPATLRALGEELQAAWRQLPIPGGAGDALSNAAGGTLAFAEVFRRALGRKTARLQAMCDVLVTEEDAAQAALLEFQNDYEAQNIASNEAMERSRIARAAYDEAGKALKAAEAQCSAVEAEYSRCRTAEVLAEAEIVALQELSASFGSS
ncbi:unnamed protein product [Polarella glacialis]|uniref:Uncharacterized protein n=1 Tax=Polarella glacialis TaxID=89957 RepID=A0A813JFU9_POLGL|nr:unnamed protein product [Polarella glacialis]